jgi:predicted transposase YbfD/YdcC
MGTHTHIIGKIVSKGGDYLLALKGNQGNIPNEMPVYFDFALRQLDLSKARGWSLGSDGEKSPREAHHPHRPDNDQPRYVRRGNESEVARIARLSVVEAESRSTTTGRKRKRERRYYFSSRKEGAEYFQHANRSHWSIENPYHWILDTAFREDQNQAYTGNAAKNLGTLRRIALPSGVVYEPLCKPHAEIMGSQPCQH